MFEDAALRGVPPPVSGLCGHTITLPGLSRQCGDPGRDLASESLANIRPRVTIFTGRIGKPGG